MASGMIGMRRCLECGCKVWYVVRCGSGMSGMWPRIEHIYLLFIISNSALRRDVFDIFCMKRMSEIGATFSGCVLILL